MSFHDVLISELGEGNNPFVHLPLIEVVAGDSELFAKQVASIATDEPLVFTSKNGVSHFLTQCEDSKCLQNEIYAIGASTAAAARAAGLSVVYVGSGKSSPVFAEEILKFNRGLKHCTLIRGASASTDLPDALQQSGVTVRNIVAYQTLKVSLNLDERELLNQWLAQSNSKSVAVFTSSLALEAFQEHLKQLERADLLFTLRIVVIGETTHEKAMTLGFKEVLLPEVVSLKAVAQLVLELTE